MNLLLVGCGKMGGALLQEWRADGMKIDVISPRTKPEGVSTYSSLAELPPSVKPDVVVFAVKPQELKKILPEYGKRFGTAPLYISIAAGITTATLKEQLGNVRVVRAMPNTPATIGEGITVLYGNTDHILAESLFAAVGMTHWVEDEELMHAVTALSGSGPAYVFLFLEALTEGAIALGLPAPLARVLAAQTVRGSASLALQSPASDYTALRQAVASPGGTTEAALKVLMADNQLKTLFSKALEAAARRSKELAG